MARLAGRKIIITGGASGIGRATARLFRREGAAVAILDRSDNAAKAVADEIGAVAIACDVSDPASVSAAVNQAAEAMGGLDGVINAAGILAETGIADTTAEVFSRTVAVNLTGTFLVIQAAAPLIQKAGKGTIVNIASGVGLDADRSGQRRLRRLQGRSCRADQIGGDGAGAEHSRELGLSRGGRDRDDRRLYPHSRRRSQPSHHRPLRNGATRPTGGAGGGDPVSDVG